MQTFQPLTNSLKYHSSGTHTRRVILITTTDSTLDQPIQHIPNTAVILLGRDTPRQLANWFRTTTNQREKFNPPLSGNTEAKIKDHLGIQKYKVDQD